MRKIMITIGLLSTIALVGCSSVGSKEFEEGSQYFYVPNAADGSISVIDPVEAKVVDSIHLGTEQASHGIALSLDGTKLFTGTGFAGKSLVVIDTNRKEKLNEINLDDGVHGIDLSPDGKYLYVSLNPGLGEKGGGLAIFDTQTMGKIADVETGEGPAHVAVTPSGSQVWVANVNGNTVSVIDTKTSQQLKIIEVGKVPNEVAITPDGKWAFVANVDSDLISVINIETLSVVKSVKAGDGPHGVTVSPDGEELWISNNNSNDITVIATRTLTPKVTIPTGSYANHVGFSKDGKFAFVSNRQSNDIVKINAENKEIIARIPVGSEPHEISLEDYVSKATNPIEYIFAYHSNESLPPINDNTEESIEERVKSAKANGVLVQGLRLLPTDDMEGYDIDFEKYDVFQLSLTTHSGDLSSLGLDKNTYLIDESGNRIAPVEWIVLSNDAHHPFYQVIFPKVEKGKVSIKMDKLDKEPITLNWEK